MKTLSKILFFLFAGNCFGTIIPDNRRIIWQGNTGIPGGITNRSTIFANVKNPPYNAAGNGIADDTAAIQAALNACPAQQVVYIPTGTYKITSPLQIKGSYTVRGDGPGLTIVNGFCGGANEVFALGKQGEGFLNCYNVFQYPPNGSFAGTPTAVTSGATLGSSNITVSSAANFATGKMFNIDELNDTNGLGVIPVGNAGFKNVDGRTGDGLYSLGQVVYITGVSGTSISFDPPLAWWFTNFNSAMATPFPCITTYAGVEDLTAYNNNTGSYTVFSLIATAYCWLKNVESGWADGDHINIDSSARCEVRECYLHDGYLHGPGTYDDTLKIQGHTSGDLIENNIFRRLHLSIFLNAACGNVFAYNFMTNGFDSNCTDCMIADTTTHGAHSLMNLYEGNVQTAFSQDGIWGTSTHGTLLRNFVAGNNWVCPPYIGRGPEQTNSFVKQTQYNHPIQLAGFANSRYFNVVGNVLGTLNMGINQPPLTGPPVYMLIAPQTRISTQGAIFTLGYSFGSDTGTDPNDNNQPWLTMINQGNWDFVSKSQTFSNSIPDHVIPQSYYLTSKPAWFYCMAWPPIDPTTGNTNFMAALIPAQYRYLYGTNPTPCFPPTPTNVNVIAIGPTIAKGAVIIK